MDHHLTPEDREFWQQTEVRGQRLISVGIEHVNRTNNVSALYTAGLRQLYVRVALGMSEDSIQEMLYLTTKSLQICFLFATGRASEVRFTMPVGKSFTIVKNEKFNPAHYTSDAEFSNAIYLSFLCNGEGLSMLADIKLEELIFSPGQSNAFYGDYVNFLRSVVIKDGQAGDWLIKAFKGTFPDQIKYGIPEYIEHNDVEHLKVWIALLGKNAQKFNDALHHAVQKHKAYWSRDKPFYKGGMIPKDDRMGLFSLPLTAICKFAQQNGIKVEVESDYLPQGFIH